MLDRRTSRTVRPSQMSVTPAGTTCIPSCCSAAACSWPSRPPRGCWPAGPAELPAGRGGSRRRARRARGGGITSVGRVFALHATPKSTSARSASERAHHRGLDRISVRVTGPGGTPRGRIDCRPRRRARQEHHGAAGHTVPAGGPAVQPEPGLGPVSAGTTANAIPDEGSWRAPFGAWTTRLDRRPDLLRELVDSVAGAYGVFAEMSYSRKVPPTVNGPVAPRCSRPPPSRRSGRRPWWHAGEPGR